MHFSYRFAFLALATSWFHVGVGFRGRAFCEGDCNGRHHRSKWLKEVIAIDTAAIKEASEAVVYGSDPESHDNNVDITATEASSKIAFLFILGSRLTQPGVWAAYFQGADSRRYSIYVHTGHDHQVEASVVEGLVGATQIASVPSKWCALFGIEVALLRAALMDRQVQQFVFVSHDAVPLTSFSRGYAEVMRSPKQSAFCTSANQRRDYGSGCRFFNNWDADIPKHEQWIALSRAHAKLIVRRAQPALAIFAEMVADNQVHRRDACSDEIVPLIALLMDVNGPINSHILKAHGIQNSCRTFVHWRDCSPDTIDDDNSIVTYAESSMHPSTFKFLPVSYILKLQQTGHLFMRKVHSDAAANWTGEAINTSGMSNSTTGDSLVNVLPQLWSSLDWQ